NEDYLTGPLRKDLLDDVAEHVGESEIAARVAIGQLLVIDSEQMQDRRVQVVDVDLPLDGTVAVLVGRAVRETALDAAARQPGGEAIRIVSAPEGLLAVLAE